MPDSDGWSFASEDAFAMLVPDDSTDIADELFCASTTSGCWTTVGIAAASGAS